jgi:hypothetical protein
MNSEGSKLRNEEGLPPVDGAALLATLVDVLIPGGDGWPSASSIGVQGIVAMRLVEVAGELELGRIADAVLAAGGPFTDRSEAERIAIVERFEKDEPDIFERLRVAVTIAYYESPFVVEAIQRLGRPYALRPHVTGYPMPAFDFNKDTPRHGRGHYIPTDAVKPVDISSLNLGDVRTARWGVER